MERLHSIWLIPRASEEANLRNAVNDLSVRYDAPDAPQFIPHLTLIGDVPIEFEPFKNALDETFKEVKAFRVKTKGVSYSEKFAKAVYIEFELDNILQDLFQSISSITVTRSLETFKPHISLIYSRIPVEEKARIAKSLNVKDYYLIDRACIVNPWKIREDDYEVENWEILYQKDLKK